MAIPSVHGDQLDLTPYETPARVVACKLSSQFWAVHSGTVNTTSASILAEKGYVLPDSFRTLAERFSTVTLEKLHADLQKARLNPEKDITIAFLLTLTSVAILAGLVLFTYYGGQVIPGFWGYGIIPVAGFVLTTFWGAWLFDKYERPPVATSILAPFILSFGSLIVPLASTVGRVARLEQQITDCEQRIGDTAFNAAIEEIKRTMPQASKSQEVATKIVDEVRSIQRTTGDLDQNPRALSLRIASDHFEKFNNAF